MASAPIPFLQDTGAAPDLTWRIALGLLVCAALAFGAVHLLRRRFPSLATAVRRGAQLQVVETRRLDGKHSLFVVSWHGDELLLGAGEGELTVLARRPAAEHAGDEPGSRA